MKAEESTINLLSKSLKGYFVRLFNSLSSINEIREILKSRTESSWRKNAPLGVLDDTEAQLVLIEIYIIDIISKFENGSRIGREIYHEADLHSSREEREFEKRQQENSNYREELGESFEKVSKQLTEKIELRFKDFLPPFLKTNDLLEKRVHRYNGGILIPGYDFHFYGDTIFVINMYPASGD